VKTVLETQEAAEAESAQDNDSDLVSLLQEVVKPSSKHDELQDFFGVEEKVHQQLLVQFIVVYMYTMISLTQSCLNNSRTAVLLKLRVLVLQFQLFESTSPAMRITLMKIIHLISQGL
jgi:hypothetical protein